MQSPADPHAYTQTAFNPYATHSQPIHMQIAFNPYATHSQPISVEALTLHLHQTQALLGSAIGVARLAITH